MKKQAIIFFALLLTLLIFPRVIFAISLQIGLGGEKSVEDLSDYIRILYLFFTPSAGILAAVMIFFGGYRWVTAAGNANKIGEAKETILSAVFGLVLALTSFILLNTINPNITALKSLYIPIVHTLTAPGGASRLCDFNGELNALHQPVLCGVELEPSSTNTNSSGESCLGVAPKDPDNYCMITQVGLGEATTLMQGTERSEIDIIGHPSGLTKFETTNGLNVMGGSGNPCGDVVVSGSTWKVGTHCSDLPTSYGNNYSWRCILEGDAGYFQLDSSVNIGYCIPLPIEHLCGKVTNMNCHD